MFTRMTKSVKNIQVLSDRPNEAGMTASELKQAFDNAGVDIQDYVNNTLLTSLEKITAGSSGAENIGSAAITNLDGTTVRNQMMSASAKIKTLQDTLPLNYQAKITATGILAGRGNGTIQSATINDYPLASLTASGVTQLSDTPSDVSNQAATPKSVNSVKAQAEAAQSSANSAQSTANTAVSNAATAQSTANSALNSASAADSKAEAAKTTANWDSISGKPTSSVTDIDLAASTVKHTAPIDSFLRGDGVYAIPAGGGGGGGTDIPFEPLASNIKANGTQSAGALTTVPRADHVHPTDTTKLTVPTGTTAQVLNGVGTPITPTATPTSGSALPFTAGGAYTQLGTKAPLANPEFTGVPTAPTPTNESVGTQIATKDYVLENGGTPSFIYKCTGSADSTDIASIVNNFFNNGTAMAMKLIITGTMGIEFYSQYAMYIDATNTRGAVCMLDFSDCNIPTITTATRDFLAIYSATAKLKVIGLVVKTTRYGVHLNNSNNNSFNMCTTSGGTSGVYLINSNNNSFNMCTTSSNLVSTGYGVYIHTGNNNNSFNMCTISGGNCVYLYSTGNNNNSFNMCTISGSNGNGVYLRTTSQGTLTFTSCKIIGSVTGIQAETADTTMVIKLTDCAIKGTSTADMNQTSAISTMKWNIKGCSFSRTSIYVNGTTTSVSTTVSNEYLSVLAYNNLFSQTIS